MAATLDRPLYVVGDAEGTALGAAALGLFALGRAPDLGGAVAQLSDPAAAAPRPDRPRPGARRHLPPPARRGARR